MKRQVSSISLPRVVAWVALALLLLMAGIRLTSAETLRESIAQKMGRLMQEQAAAHKPDEPSPPPFVGPTFIAAYAALACSLAAIMTFLAGRAGAMTRFRLGQLAVMALLLMLSAGSAFHADNRFGAVIGTADLLASLAAAWTIVLACHEQLLGQRGRQVVIAALLAILTLGVVKGHMQHFIEFPDDAKLVSENPDKWLRENGIDPDNDVSRKLFMARLKSAEVFGFSGMSNVYATQMIADVTLLAALGLAGLLFLARPSQEPAVAVKTRGRQVPPRDAEVPVHLVAIVAIGVLLLAGMAVLPMTESKGGSAAALLAIAMIIAGGVCWRAVARHRRMLLGLLAAAAILLPAAVVGYGVWHHGLPTRSLLFRWQYWTGAWDIITRHPLWGVGFNNFGDYYPQFKLPSWPEDVSDPHSFFVRYAAELGLPALLAVVILLLMMLRAALGRQSGQPRSATSETPAPAPALRPMLVNAGIVALAWIPLHFLTEVPVEYNIIMALMLVALAWGVFAAVMALQTVLTPRGNRYVALAAVAAAAAMLLYDQVNMALVAGPVAMLFWMLLAVGDARSDDAPAGKRVAQGVGLAGGILAVVIVAWLLIPLTQDAGPGDPSPFEIRYIRAAYPAEGPALTIREADGQEAISNLNAAIALSPHSIELLVQRFDLNCRLHLPVAADARKILELDRSNAGIRYHVAVPDTDLPPAERRKALLDALAFDQQLDPLEAKRLSAAQIAEIQGVLARLPP